MIVHLDKNEDIINICFDNVFKAVFTKGTPESLAALAKPLSAVTGRDVESVSIMGNEPAIDNLRDRQVRFDVHCKASTGEYFNVEISMYPDEFEPVRLEFYTGKLFTGQDIRGVGKTYGDLKEAYQIAFLATRKFFRDEEFLHEFKYYDAKRGVSLGGLSRITTIELAKLGQLAEKPVVEMTPAERWAFCLRYISDKEKRDKMNEILEQEEGIAMASQVLVSISRDEHERARLLSEYKYIVDTQSKVVQAERDGRRKGWRKGLHKGRRKGKREGILEIARTLKSIGDPVEKISRVTGLSAEEIAKL